MNLNLKSRKKVGLGALLTEKNFNSLCLSLARTKISNYNQQLQLRVLTFNQLFNFLSLLVNKSRYLSWPKTKFEKLVKFVFLDRVFQGQYPPSLSIDYVVITKIFFYYYYYYYLFLFYFQLQSTYLQYLLTNNIWYLRY